MTKNEFLQLFELSEIYEQYKSRNIFGFGLFDNLIGSRNFIIYNFNERELQITFECTEFQETAQIIELHLYLNNEQVELNMDNPPKNEIFSFLTFDTHLDSSLKFLANFINKILKPKYQLIGSISIY